MTRLLKLNPVSEDSPAPTIIDPVIQQCHARLVRSDYADSLEVRIALLAELVFRSYIQLSNTLNRSAQ